MQIDELRGELAALADEIETFHGDSTALHRRVRRRRVVISSLALAVAVVVAVSSVAIAHKRSDSRVNVQTTGSKEVAASAMTHVDLIVVPATPGVQQILDASPLVDRYSPIPVGPRPADPRLDSPAQTDVLCALETGAGFAIDTVSSGTVFGDLSRSLAGQAHVFDVSGQWGTDAELFLQEGATQQASDSLRTALMNDPDVLSFRYLSHNDAYAIFKRDFADQPALVLSTKPSDLPTSFRVIVRPGHSVAALVQRYEHRTGVDIVTTPQAALADLFTPVPSSALQKLLEQGFAGPGRVEVFMHIDSDESQIYEIRGRIRSDPDVTSFQYIDQAAAYSIFKSEFADQPSLLQGTKASDLPVSFRVDLKPGVSQSDFAARYESLTGVATVTTGYTPPVSACTKPATP